LSLVSGNWFVVAFMATAGLVAGVVLGARHRNEG
jgi:hypothetical protein